MQLPHMGRIYAPPEWKLPHHRTVPVTCAALALVVLLPHRVGTSERKEDARLDTLVHALEQAQTAAQENRIISTFEHPHVYRPAAKQGCWSVDYDSPGMPGRLSTC